MGILSLLGRRYMLWSGEFYSFVLLVLVEMDVLTWMDRGITRDEATYPDAEAFNPRRWLDPSFTSTYREPLTQYPNLNGFSQFGFGRRTCQGIPIVEQDLFLTMGGMAWAFDIRKKRDPETGLEVPVHWNDYTPLLIAKPAKFEFNAVARSEEKKRMMREMYEDANARMESQDQRGGADARGALNEFKSQVVVHAAEAGVSPVDVEVEDELQRQRAECGRGGGKSESGSSVRDSSPEPSLSSGDSSRDSETDLDEEVSLELRGMSVLERMDYNKKKGLVAEEKYFYKMEPAVMVLDVPGAWRWS